MVRALPLCPLCPLPLPSELRAVCLYLPPDIISFAPSPPLLDTQDDITLPSPSHAQVVATCMAWSAVKVLLSLSCTAWLWWVHGGMD